MHANSPLSRPKALLFDMDGTLTEPLLDFAKIKAEMGIGNAPILESIKRMNGARKAECEAILHRHEDQASRDSTLNPGCGELLEWVRAQGFLMALVTRNSLRSTRIVFERHGLDFEVFITRDDGLYKPDPAPLFRACERLGISVDDAWMIGDGSYDIEAAVAAGMRSVWVSHGLARPFQAEPTHVVTGLEELLQMLQKLS